MKKVLLNKERIINHLTLLFVVVFMTSWLYLAPRIGDDVQNMKAIKGGDPLHSNEYFNHGYWNVASLV